MIENIRKYNILIIIGLVVVAAALIIGLNSGNMRGPGGSPYIKIGARTYTDTEYRQLGQYGREVVQSLAQAGDFQSMYQFLFKLAPNSMFSSSPEDSTEAFFINRMLIRQAKEEFGIHPSEEQVNDFTRNLAAFRGANQEFDPEMYARYLERGLGRMGMGEKQFRDLISDIIATDYLSALVSTGLVANPDAVGASYTLDQQKISGSVARLELAPFKEEIAPTDEELKAYWELIQDAFKTSEQRRFSYILLAPKPVEEQASTEEKKEPTLADAAMTDEQKAAAAKEKAEKEAAKQAEIAEAKRKAQNELKQTFSAFIDKLENSQGENLEDLVAEYGWELQSTELFEVTSAPEDLKLNLRNSRRGGQAVDQLFKMITTSDPISKISEPMGVGENQWMVARLDEVIASKVKSFDQAREEVLKQYIDEKASEALEKAMDEAAKKVSAALADGKEIADAFLAADLTKVEPFESVSRQSKPAAVVFPTGLFQKSRTIKPGGISEPIVSATDGFLIYVSAREVEEGLITEDSLSNQASIASNQNSMSAFGDWLKARNETAQVERLYRPQ